MIRIIIKVTAKNIIHNKMGGYMKKGAVFIIIVFLIVAIIVVSRLLYVFLNDTISLQTNVSTPKPLFQAKNSDNDLDEEYEVRVDNKLVSKYDTYEEALEYAKTRKNSSISLKNKSKWLWDNYIPYHVFIDKTTYYEFETFKEAVTFAKEHDRSFIYYRKDNMLIWSNAETLKQKHQIENVELIKQNPELPRGCEVTSLAMLINYKGINVSKTTLAEQIEKDPTPRKVKNGKIYNGNPNVGFVGSIDDNKKFGFGVYHAPIHRLLSEYFPRSSIDLTGCEFEDLFYVINGNTPVWVIINTSYEKLQKWDEVWVTEQGEINITYKEHSVLVTGYDENYIYFNDPLGEKSFAPKESFKEAWIQMGSQAVTLSW